VTLEPCALEVLGRYAVALELTGDRVAELQREEQHAGGGAIESMHGIQFSADLVAQALQDELAVPRQGSAVNQHVRRLADRDQGVVAVQNETANRPEGRS
jgi:hypothetical protein